MLVQTLVFHFMYMCECGFLVDCIGAALYSGGGSVSVTHLTELYSQELLALALTRRRCFYLRNGGW
jgi:hypothetical protein